MKNKFRVLHFAQIPCNPFIVEVSTREEANLIKEILANQHLFLFENKIIPDYANIIICEEFDDEIDEETNEPYGWIDLIDEDEF